MEFRAIQPNHPNFKEAMALYDATFPSEIREPVQVFLDAFKIQQTDPDFFHFHVLTDDEQFVGFSSFHYLHKENIAYIVYIVIDDNYKGQGFGSLFMRHIFDSVTSLAAKYHPTQPAFMLECEQDETGQSPLEAFYNKFDFVKSSLNYYQPDLAHLDQHVPMNLFIKNKPSKDAILAMYYKKYHECNHVKKATLETLMNHF